jgi:hypothetical protein
MLSQSINSQSIFDKCVSHNRFFLRAKGMTTKDMHLENDRFN